MAGIAYGQMLPQQEKEKIWELIDRMRENFESGLFCPYLENLETTDTVFYCLPSNRRTFDNEIIFNERRLKVEKLEKHCMSDKESCSIFKQVTQQDL